MTPEQRAAALRLIDYFSQVGATIGEREAATLLRELASEPVQEATPADMAVYDAIAANYKQEPVASFEDWVTSLTPAEMYDFDSEGRGYKKDRMRMMRMAWDAAIAAAPQQRQPLTEVQITELAEQCGYDGAVPTVRLAFQGFKLDDFAHAVERAHGIVEEA